MEEKEIVSCCVSNLSVYTTLQCSVVGGIERDGKGRDNDGGDGEEEKEYFGNDYIMMAMMMMKSGVEERER